MIAGNSNKQEENTGMESQQSEAKNETVTDVAHVGEQPKSPAEEEKVLEETLAQAAIKTESQSKILYFLIFLCFTVVFTIPALIALAIFFIYKNHKNSEPERTVDETAEQQKRGESRIKDFANSREPIAKPITAELLNNMRTINNNQELYVVVLSDEMPRFIPLTRNFLLFVFQAYKDCLDSGRAFNPESIYQKLREKLKNDFRRANPKLVVRYEQQLACLFNASLAIITGTLAQSTHSEINKWLVAESPDTTPELLARLGSFITKLTLILERNVKEIEATQEKTKESEARIAELKEHVADCKGMKRYCTDIAQSPALLWKGLPDIVTQAKTILEKEGEAQEKTKESGTGKEELMKELELLQNGTGQLTTRYYVVNHDWIQKTYIDKLPDIDRREAVEDMEYQHEFGRMLLENQEWVKKEIVETQPRIEGEASKILAHAFGSSTTGNIHVSITHS